jgi:hypothetical protein
MPDVRDRMTEKEVRADDNLLIPDPWHLSSDNDRGRDAQTATPEMASLATGLLEIPRRLA